MPRPVARFNLPAIEACLRRLQQESLVLDGELAAEREPFSSEILDNLLAGYRYIDRLLSDMASGGEPVLPFSEGGHSSGLLELNNIVLYGTDPERRERYASSLKACEKRLYTRRGGGIDDLVNTYRLHQHESLWHRCAVVYVHTLSQPQLFIEGNHRTAALLVSYLLALEARPPLVMGSEEARGLLALSASIGRWSRHSIAMRLRLRRLRKSVARIIREQSNPLFLLEPKVEADARA
jgi:hypothetical protein